MARLSHLICCSIVMLVIVAPVLGQEPPEDELEPPPELADPQDQPTEPVTEEEELSPAQEAPALNAPTPQVAPSPTPTPLPRPVPPPRAGHSAAWDPVTRQMFIFGGHGNRGQYQDDLWRYQPATNAWTQIFPTGRPPPARTSHSAVWDLVGSQMLVYGGELQLATPTLSSDLWAFHPASNSWVELRPTGQPPVPRLNPTTVWDSRYGRMLMFGGQTAEGQRMNDLWSFEPADNWWRRLFPVRGRVPSGRLAHSAVWDTTRGEMIVFGGLQVAFPVVNDLWSYRVESGDWLRLMPVGPLAPPLQLHAAVWDPVSEQMLVFGGLTEDAGNLRTVLTFNRATNTWMDLRPPGPAPQPRAWHTAVWDSAGSQMLVFGGFGVDGILNDLWSYRPVGNQWIYLAP